MAPLPGPCLTSLLPAALGSARPAPPRPAAHFAVTGFSGLRAGALARPAWSPRGARAQDTCYSRSHLLWVADAEGKLEQNASKWPETLAQKNWGHTRRRKGLLRGVSELQEWGEAGVPQSSRCCGREGRPNTSRTARQSREGAGLLRREELSSWPRPGVTHPQGHRGTWIQVATAPGGFPGLSGDRCPSWGLPAQRPPAREHRSQAPRPCSLELALRRRAPGAHSGTAFADRVALPGVSTLRLFLRGLEE